MTPGEFDRRLREMAHLALHELSITAHLNAPHGNSSLPAHLTTRRWPAPDRGVLIDGSTTEDWT